MATLNITLNSICSGGGHLKITSNINGGVNRVYELETANIKSAVTDAEAKIFFEIYLKIYSIGKTNLQIRDGLTAGLAGTI